MSSTPVDFVHPSHISVFVDAAREFKCHILVRKTGHDSIRMIGKPGYTGKRADMKAKTAKANFGRYELAGLVCSPHIHPYAFPAERLADALKEWSKSIHLITTPPDQAGFSDNHQPRCLTPYLLQANPHHKHYGCIALVEMGLLLPRYVHGDYDLYAIIPAGKPFDLNKVAPRLGSLGSSMRPTDMGLKAFIDLSVANAEGDLSFKVANYINMWVAGHTPDFLGALMVNHGEQINLVEKRKSIESVLAFSPEMRQGSFTTLLNSPDDFNVFYQTA